MILCSTFRSSECEVSSWGLRCCVRLRRCARIFPPFSTNTAHTRRAIANGEPASESPPAVSRVYVKNHSASNETSSPNSHDPTANAASTPIAVGIVDVTHRQWRTPLLQAQASLDSIRDTFNSPSELRDRFLNVLDSDDHSLLKRIALDLVRSRNPLPGMTCEKLGLPLRSTYGAAARHVLACL